MYNLLVFIYFIYVQVLPTTQDSIQLAIMLMLIATTVLKFVMGLSTQKPLNKPLNKNKNLVAFKILIINSFIFTSFGFLANQPGAEELLFLETIFPLIYLVMFSTGSRDNMVRILNLCFTTSTFIIGVLFLLQILNFGGGSDFLINLSDSSEVQGIATNSDGRLTGLRFIPLYSLSYLTSISLHNLASSINEFFRKTQSKNIKNILMENFTIIIHLFNFSSTLFCIILSGRQGLILGFLGSLLLIIVVQWIVSSRWKDTSINYIKQGGQHIKFMLSTILFFIVLILLVNSLVEFVKIDYEYIQSFMSKNEGDTERIGQFSSLANGWYDSPIIGHGNGSTVPVVRDPARPWRYELGYMMRLNNMGLLGISMHFIGISLICISLIKNFYKTGKIVYMSSLAGLFSLLIADGTNPYMVRFTVLYYLYYCLWLSMNKEDPVLEKS
jgi:hypothetical protein